MTNKQVLLEEWKQRYDSYRQYRTNYVTVLSAGATAALFLLSYVFSAKIERYPKLILLLLVFLIAVTLIIAHFIARPNLKKLGDRLETLENQLGMEPFKTTSILQSALVVSHYFSWLAALIVLMILIEAFRGAL